MGSSRRDESGDQEPEKVGKELIGQEGEADQEDHDQAKDPEGQESKATSWSVFGPGLWQPEAEESLLRLAGFAVPA